ncbi:MAG: pilus assembly protein PilM [Candidatus Omnitrophica bacterium]|nr:pilus assembly protein PilM [Candidatus Omnitrophota bacterium]
MQTNILSIINRKTVTGLYIGPDTVDVVVLKGSLKGPKLVTFGQTYIYPKDKIAGEEVSVSKMSSDVPAENVAQKETIKKTRDDYIVEAIQRVFKENDLKAGSVICAISSEDVMVRYFQMPKIPKQEWASAINFEAKRYIPFRMEEVASDFKVMTSKSPSSGMDVVFVAVKQKLIERLVTMVERAGIKPIIVEPAPFSLIRAFSAADQISTKVNTAIVNIETKGASISILKNGIPYIIRDIPFEETARERKSIEPVFEKLLAEIKLSFDFYEKQFPLEVIDKIIIYSCIPLENWHELVGKELQIPVEVGDPLRGIRIKKGVVPPRLAVAFGLALRDISEPYIDINLYKEKILAYKRKELFIRMLFLEASAAIFLLILLKVLCIRAIAPLSKEFNDTLKERPRVEVSIKSDDIAELERLKNKMDARKTSMENIISSRIYLTKKLAALANTKPGNIWLTELNYEEDVDKKRSSKILRRLAIKGYCIIANNVRETDIVNNFLIDLQKQKEIKEGMSKSDIVSVQKTELENENVASFEILFTGP